MKARLLIILTALAALVACARPPDLIGVDGATVSADSVPDATQHRIFITTSRLRSADEAVFYTTRRSETLGLASVAVSVPPDHEAGQLERPQSLPPDPLTEFVAISPLVYARDRDFIAAINAELSKRSPEDRNVLLFIHGFNSTVSNAVIRIAQFVEDSGFKGVPVLFSWASAGRTSRYVYDLNSVLAARPLLDAASGVLVQTNAQGFDVFAHSMGALLLMEVMLQADLQGQLGASGKLNNVMLAAPDIDIDVFRSQLGQIRNDPGNMFVFISRDDYALRASRRLSGGIDRVGAATEEELAGLGVTVIDLSRIADSSSGSHFKFAGSPEVVRLIGRNFRQHNFETTHSETIFVDAVEDLPILGELVQ